jgi:hypothetical protein
MRVLAGQCGWLDVSEQRMDSTHFVDSVVGSPSFILIAPPCSGNAATTNDMCRHGREHGRVLRVLAHADDAL